MKTKRIIMASYAFVAMAGAVLVSCSKGGDVIEKNKPSLEANEKQEYRSYYEQKYGKIDPNQSWDFTSFSGAAKTRAAGDIVINDISDPQFLQPTLHADKGGVKSALDNTQAEGFNPNVCVNVYPGWCYNEKLKNLYVQLEVQYQGGNQILSTVQIKNKAWWSNNGATAPSNSGVGINTTGLTNAVWKANILDNQKNVIGTYTIENYKVVTVNERTYWCFDIIYGNEHVTLIYLVLPRPLPVAKRYLIEDLGSKNDFDFNDVVVDVMEDNGSQKAIIRAMGGTLDFTLTIGNTTWTKSVEGAALGYKVETMYNTQNPDYTAKLAEFPVTGWSPASNNVSLAVESGASNGVIITVPFPKQGEAPMIIALNTYINWQTERVALPENWWYPIGPSEE